MDLVSNRLWSTPAVERASTSDVCPNSVSTLCKAILSTRRTCPRKQPPRPRGCRGTACETRPHHLAPRHGPFGSPHARLYFKCHQDTQPFRGQGEPPLAVDRFDWIRSNTKRTTFKQKCALKQAPSRKV